MEPTTPAGLHIGGLSVDDLITMHLTNCTKCRDATEHRKPVRNGVRTNLCNEYLHLQILRANYEGEVNNIVAYTELGDEAPKLGTLD